MPTSPTPKHRFSLWPLIWLAIFVTNFILGLLAPESDILTLIRLGGILLCLLYATITFPRHYLLLLALLTTCLSDLILAFNNTSLVGLLFFLTTQLIHLFRLAGPSRRRAVATLLTFAILFLLANTAFPLFQPIILIAILYASTLALNIYASARWLLATKRPSSALPVNPADRPAARRSLIGFILFACCDTCTALSYLSLITIFPTFLYAPANFLAWFFYYPSQVLISTSGRRDQ